jgi:predicted dehydrogenase
MAIEGKAGEKLGRRLRLGMVGGGQGAFIGGVHRIAARLDDRYELVAGALSADPAKAKASAAELRIAPDRAASPRWRPRKKRAPTASTWSRS